MKKLLICLEYDGRVLREIRSDELKSAVSIGRDAACDWSLAGVDPSASARHAELFRSRGAVWIRDLGSRNGITCAGERVSRRRIRAGDRFHIGSCTLSAEAVAERDPRDVLPYHRLEQLNGPDAGRVLELVGPADIVVGSDPSCALCCLDPLVSREHASLAVKPDGSVWARDLGSRNGTSVNGAPLAKDKERMLRDGDVLSVAYIEFRFTDKDVVHPRAHLLRKAGIAAATVAVVLAGWYAYASVRPSAKALIRDALDLAAAERFDEAESVVRQATEARGAGPYARRIEEVLRNLEAWKETSGAWGRGTNCLAARDWDGFQEESVHFRGWDWSRSAPAEGIRAKRALDLVQAFRAAQHVLEDGDGEESLASAIAKLSSATNALQSSDVWPSSGIPWAGALFADVGTILPELTNTLCELREIDAIVSGGGLEDPVPDGGLTGAAISELKRAETPSVAGKALARLDGLLAANRLRRAHSEGGMNAVFRPSRVVELRVGEFLPPFGALTNSEAVFAANVHKIASAEFGSDFPSLPLPDSGIQCVSDYASFLRECNKRLCSTVLTGWKDRYESLFRLGVVNDSGDPETPRELARLFDKRWCEEALRFVKSAALPVAMYGSEKPLRGCYYDKFVGIHAFVDFLDSLVDNFDPEMAVSEDRSAFGTDTAETSDAETLADEWEFPEERSDIPEPYSGFRELPGPDVGDSVEQSIGKYENEGGWKTVVMEARSVCDRLRRYRDYGNGRENAGRIDMVLARLVRKADVPGGTNRIGIIGERAEELLEDTDIWVSTKFPAICGLAGEPAPITRAAILARGVKLLLSENPDADEARELAKEWLQFRRLSSLANPAGINPETVARDVFNETMPGTSVFQKAWKKLHDAGKTERKRTEDGQ